MYCRSGGTGRRVALKMLWGQPRESSSLSFGTSVPFCFFAEVAELADA